MPWEIIWTKKAKNSLKLLDKIAAERVISKVEALGGRENVVLEHVTGKDFYKLRVGNYRVLVDRFSSKKVLAILFVGHRKNVYKKMRH